MSEKFTEILVSPVSQMIRELGASVAEASVALNANQLQMLLDYPDDLAQAGMIPTVYHMQTVEVELQIALHLEQKTDTARKWGLFAAPMNAKYQSALNYSANGSSKLKITFAPGPPPAALTDQGG